MKNWLKENWYKVSMLIIFLILAIGFVGYLNTKNELAKKELENRNMREAQERVSKEAEERKDYVAKQKVACLEIYQTETKQWNNVASWDYDEYKDKCVITYRENEKKPKSVCESYIERAKEIYKDAVIPPESFSFYLHCLEGTFTKEF